ncbi:MarR family winged helix-turn-helix transcriptional regulator [Pseudopelagicola sp. nBUS_20]|uniref:MarR family winged helix-turn-helix transcriptional regulator n=1 Tax=Pseudopelagicola sp. nBUS_20 TaxID=3395317 RepID=UPI003EB71E93
MPKKEDFSIQDFLPYLLHQAAEESSLTFQRIYKNRYGMLRTEWRVLFHLGTYGEMTATEICTRARIHKTKVSRAVQKLVERRILVRERSEEDRRVEKLKLTAVGRAAYRDLRSVAESYEDALRAEFTTDEVALLHVMLRRLAGLSGPK